MSKDRFRGRWSQLRSQIRLRWGELTDDDLDQVEGRPDQLIGSIQARYGLTRSQAEGEFYDFLDKTKFELFDQPKRRAARPPGDPPIDPL